MTIIPGAPNRRILPIASLLFALAPLVLSGCATARYEAEPTVVEQPPNMTTDEAVEKGVEVLGEKTPESVLKDAGAHVVVAHGGRYAPTTRTIGEVREGFAAAPPPLDFAERLDTAHDQVYVWMQNFVENTDHYFAKSGTQLAPVPAAPFRLGLIGEVLDRPGGVDLNLDLDVHIDLQLPNIERRLRLFVTSENLDEAPRNTGDDSGLRAGLRYELLKYVDFDIGAKLDLPPVAFASVRWRRQFDLTKNVEFYPFAKIFLDTEESLGYSAAATFDYRPGRTLVRSSSYVKWRDDRDETEWSQVFIFARAHELILPDRYGSYLNTNDIGRGWGVRLYAKGLNMHGAEYYESGVFFKRPTAHKWLFWYVEPLVRWDEKYDWEADPGIRIGIDALFWDLARASKPR